MQIRKYDPLLENLNVGYFYIDKDGIIQEVNKAWIKLYKYNSRDEIIGRHFAEIQKIDDMKKAEAFVHGIMTSDPEYMTGEFSRKCKDGSIGYHSFSASPVLKNNIVVGIEGVIIDCTARKKLEEELRRNKETLEGYLNTAAEIVMTLDANGIITHLNENGHKLLGYKTGELIGKNWFDCCIPESNIDEIKTVFNQLMQGKIENTRNYENQVINKKGEIKTIYWHNTLLTEETGKIIGTLSSGEDISDLKQAQNKAVREEEFIKSLLNAIPTPVFYKDREGAYLGCNRAFTEIMGITSQEMEGKTVFDLWPSEHAEIYHKKDLELMNDPEHQIYEFKVKDKNGEIRPVIYAKDVFYDEAGEVAGLVGAFLDISYQKQVENELRQARADWENIFNSISDPTMIITPDHTIIAANKATIEILSLTEDQLIGKKCHVVLHKRDSVPGDCPFQDLISSKEPVMRQMKIEILNGIYLVTASPVFDEEGKVKKIIHFAKDISKLEELKSAVNATEARNKAILDAIPDLMFIQDKAGTYLDYYATDMELLFKPPELFIGKKMKDIFPKEFSDFIQTAIDKVIAERKMQRRNYDLVLNEEQRFFEARIVPYEKDKVLSIIRDITEIEEAEKALKDSEERLNLTVNRTGLGIWDQNFQTGEIIRNENWAEMLGYELEDVGRELDFFLAHIHPDDLEKVKKAIADHEAGKTELYIIEHRMKHKNGSWIWVNDVGRIIERDKNGKPLRALGFHEDITERKKAEEQLRISKQKLQILNKIIRHDLANDFNVIKSAVNLFKRRSDQKMIEEINKRATTSLETIKKYKEYEAFIESNLELEVIDLKEVIQDVLTNHKELKIDIAGSGKVLADQALISVFNNLFYNSLIHGKADYIKIKITSDLEYCYIHIKDNGMGVPDKIREKIFEEGFAYGKTGNTGMGLFIARKTIENYGGEISLAKGQSKGATFKLKLKKAYFREI